MGCQVTTQTVGTTEVGNHPAKQHVIKAAKRHGVDTDFALRVAYAESRFNCKARSKAGARGIMQVMPGTGRKYGYSPSQLMSCAKGADAGVRELKYCLGLAKGNKSRAAICYNCGPGCLDGRRLPRETKAYIGKVS